MFIHSHIENQVIDVHPVLDLIILSHLVDPVPKECEVSEPSCVVRLFAAYRLVVYTHRLHVYVEVMVNDHVEKIRVYRYFGGVFWGEDVDEMSGHLCFAYAFPGDRRDAGNRCG